MLLTLLSLLAFILDLGFRLPAILAGMSRFRGGERYEPFRLNGSLFIDLMPGS
jgi:hypothetical protein